MVSSLTIPFLKEHVLPFKIREKIPYRIERIILAAASALLFYIAKLKSRLGIASLKDRLRLADSFLVDGITAHNMKVENTLRGRYKSEWTLMEDFNKEYETDYQPDPLDSGFFRDITREPFVFVNKENISLIGKNTVEEKQKLYTHLNKLVDQKFDVLATYLCQTGWIRETLDEPRRVFENLQCVPGGPTTLAEIEKLSNPEKFVKNFSSGYGLVVDKDRYRLIFHSIYHFDFKKQKQEGVVGCRREYIFSKEDVETFNNDLKTEEMFPNLKVMDIYSPMIFCKPGEALEVKYKIIHDLYKDVPRVIGVLE